MAAKQHTTLVEYKEIPGWTGFFMGSDRSLWSSLDNHRKTRDQWKSLKTWKTSAGTERITLNSKGKSQSFSVHKLFLITFGNQEFDRSLNCRDIPGFKGYLACETGSIWSYRYCLGEISRGINLECHPRKLKEYTNKNGYKSVKLRQNAKTVNITVHKIILISFVGPCPEGMECCHGDGNPANNSLINLRWDTRRENSADTIRHGRIAKGERNGSAKLTDEEAAVIRNMTIESVAERNRIAKQFKVHPYTIVRIKAGKTRAATD